MWTFWRSVVGVDWFLEVSLRWLSSKVRVCIDARDVHRTSVSAFAVLAKNKPRRTSAVRTRVLPRELIYSENDERNLNS